MTLKDAQPTMVLNNHRPDGCINHVMPLKTETDAFPTGPDPLEWARGPVDQDARHQRGDSQSIPTS